MWKLRLISHNTKINFLRFRSLSLGLSLLLVLASIALVSVKGLNFGIDFKGGTLIEINTKTPANIADLRAKLNTLGLGEVSIQQFGAPNDVLIRLALQGEDAKGDLASVAKVREKLGDSVEFRRVEIVGPKVSGELIQSGTIAVLLAIILMLLYIWLRFEWQFSVGAVIALMHDVILTIGIFSVLQLDFGLPILAAILTIVGYSMNDTVVVYDRVRENLRKYKRMDLLELLNLSINATLSRTVMTSVTTLLALISLYTLGGEVIRGFTFAMIWGVVIGTYSSIFIAAPLLVFLGRKNRLRSRKQQEW